MSTLIYVYNIGYYYILERFINSNEVGGSQFFVRFIPYFK